MLHELHFMARPLYPSTTLFTAMGTNLREREKQSFLSFLLSKIIIPYDDNNNNNNNNLSPLQNWSFCQTREFTWEFTFLNFARQAFTALIARFMH